MTKSFILGMDSHSDFNAEDVFTYVPLADNIDFQGIVLDENDQKKVFFDASEKKTSKIMEAHTHLNKLSSDLKVMGVQMSIPGNYVLNVEKLVENSMLYDLFCSGNDLLNEEHYLYHNSLLDLKCPVFLFPHKPKDIDHLLLLFDGTASSMAVIKKGLKLFGDQLSKTSVSVLALHDHNVKQTYREHLIVSFLLSRFPDVGILAIQKENLNKEMLRILKKDEGIMVFTGHYGAEIILNSELKEYIRTFNNPLFFTF